MKKTFLFLVCASLVLFGLGCETNKTRVGEGSIIGGALGAAGGGLISGSAQGAGIGLLAGVATGALIGSHIDKEQQAAAVISTQMTMSQIIDLTKQGTSEDVIVDKIKVTNSKFNLSAQDIAALKQQGVTEKVLNAMQGK